jgi:hypothetical protein
VRGDHHDRHGAHRAHHPQCLVATKIGQPEIKQDEVGRRVENMPQRGHGAGRGGNRMTVFGEHPNQRAANRRVVFH